MTILLPRHFAAASATLATQLVDHDKSAPLGHVDEIILVVEDEDQVRRPTVEALRTSGYTVRHAADATNALAVIYTHQGIKLLVSDIVLPGINGRDPAATISRTHRSIRILLVTDFERDQVEGDEHRILRKPFGMETLGRRVRLEFDRSTRSLRPLQSTRTSLRERAADRDSRRHTGERYTRAGLPAIREKPR